MIADRVTEIRERLRCERQAIDLGYSSPAQWVDDAEALLAALEGERAKLAALERIHAPECIYPLNDHGSPDPEAEPLLVFCRECTPDHTVGLIEDAEWNEDWPTVAWPCLTAAALRPDQEES